MKATTLRRTVRSAVVVSIIVAAVAITWNWGVNPVQNWLAQREQIVRLEAELQEVTDSNEGLAEDIRRLHTDAEIERIARRDLGLVYPGEEAYIIDLPSEVLDSG